MSLGGLLAFLVLIVLVVAYVGAPFFAKFRRHDETASIQHQRDRVLVYYERVLTNVRDLEEDHATGKIAPNEYQIERELWTQRGIELLKLLDSLDAKESLVQSANSDEAEIDAAIEQAIQMQRSHQT